MPGLSLIDVRPPSMGWARAPRGRAARETTRRPLRSLWSPLGGSESVSGPEGGQERLGHAEGPWRCSRALLCVRDAYGSSEAGGGGQVLRAVRGLPGEVRLLAAEVAVRGGLRVDRAEQVEVA